MTRLPLNGLAITDLNATFFEPRPIGDSRVSTRDYGYIAFNTSGSTGQSKVVLYSKLTLLSCAAAISSRLAVSDAAQTVSYIRPNLADGLSIVHSHHMAGSNLEFRHSPSDPFVLQRDVALLPENCAIYLFPIQAAQLSYGDSYRPDRRTIDFRIAGALLPSNVAAKLADRYPNASITNMYGQSELGPRISVWRGPISEYSEGLVGKPLAGVRVQIETDVNDVGPIWVSTPYRMMKYLGDVPPEVTDPEATRLLWMRTGDLGYFTEYGNLVLTGRQSGQANVAGELIPISSIESAVRSLDSVATCKVAVEKHPTLGELAVIWVVPASDRSAPDELVKVIRRALSEGLGRGAALSRVRVVTDAESVGKL